MELGFLIYYFVRPTKFKIENGKKAGRVLEIKQYIEKHACEKFKNVLSTILMKNLLK